LGPEDGRNIDLALRDFPWPTDTTNIDVTVVAALNLPVNTGDGLACILLDLARYPKWTNKRVSQDSLVTLDS